MIDLYFAPTPNGWKVSIMLEECGLPYTPHLIRLVEGDQLTPEFLKISPNAKMPAIVDHDVESAPVPVFESGAILWYLAEKTGKFLSTDALVRKETMEWMFWQVGNQGPMAGQLAHFKNYAPEGDLQYAYDRYKGETERNLAVLDRRLEAREFIVGEYSIADMIAFPWVLVSKYMDAPHEAFTNVTRWRNTIKQRPAVQKGVNLLKEHQNHGQTAATNNILFNQSAEHLRSRGGNG